MNKLKKFSIIGTVFTIIVGSLLHFVYEWSGNNPIIGVFSAVNESTFEHLKLLFVPMLIFSIIEYFIYGKKYENFIPVKTLSIIIGMLTIIITFYTYVGIIGTNYLIADISTFILGVFLSYLFSYKILPTSKFKSKKAQILGIIGIILLTVSFIVFTFYPPHIGLFKDPVTGMYGI